MDEALLTTENDARQIVKWDELWVAVHYSVWQQVMRAGHWNDMLYETGLQIPVERVRIGRLDDVLKVGWICRPLEKHINFQAQPIVVRKYRRTFKRSDT